MHLRENAIAEINIKILLPQARVWDSDSVSSKQNDNEPRMADRQVVKVINKVKPNVHCFIDRRRKTKIEILIRTAEALLHEL